MSGAIEGGLASDAGFTLDLGEPKARPDVMFPPPTLRRPWNHRELLSIFPSRGLRVLDVGAGRNPLRVRPVDELVTVDFESEAETMVTADVATDWPFGPAEFDLVYMSHVVEHFYPRDRDAVIRNVFGSMRPGALLLIRVPHRSSFNSAGWEHHSTYGLAEAVSLCHGHNPTLPMFRTVSVGASMSIDFYSERSRARGLLERGLSRSWRLTELVLARLVGGIAEVQFLLQRMPAATERELREGSIGYL